MFQFQGSVKRHVIEDRFTAIRAAISIAQKDDVVLIAGRGAQVRRTRAISASSSRN